MLIRIFLAFLLLGCVNARADYERVVEGVVTQDSLGNVYTTLQAGGTLTYFTKSFSVKNDQMNQTVGFMYKANSTGIINLTIVPQQSFQRPTTEQINDATYVNWKVTGGATTTADSNWKIATLDTVIVPFGRFQIIGGSGNDNSTTIQIKVGK